jgi:hypothetical protein
MDWAKRLATVPRPRRETLPDPTRSHTDLCFALATKDMLDGEQRWLLDMTLWRNDRVGFQLPEDAGDLWNAR